MKPPSCTAGGSCLLCTVQMRLGGSCVGCAAYGLSSCGAVPGATARVEGSPEITVPSVLLLSVSEGAERLDGTLNYDILRQRLAGNARRLVEQRHAWGPIGRDFVRLVESTVAVRVAGRPAG